MVGQGCYNKTKHRVDGRMKNRVLTDNSMRKNQERVMNITQSRQNPAGRPVRRQYPGLWQSFTGSASLLAALYPQYKEGPQDFFSDLGLERGPVWSGPVYYYRWRNALDQQIRVRLQGCTQGGADRASAGCRMQSGHVEIPGRNRFLSANRDSA